MTEPAPSMAVMHLDTGHVVAAAAVSGAPATVESLTGGTHVAVRIPPDTVVDVPAEMLTLTSIDRDHDVLAAPTSYRMVDSSPPVIFAGAPSSLPSPVTGTPGSDVLMIWQVGPGVEVTRVEPAADGSVVVTKPDMATHGIVAIPGRPLSSDT